MTTQEATTTEDEIQVRRPTVRLIRKAMKRAGFPTELTEITRKRGTVSVIILPSINRTEWDIISAELDKMEMHGMSRVFMNDVGSVHFRPRAPRA